MSSTSFVVLYTRFKRSPKRRRFDEFSEQAGLRRARPHATHIFVMTRDHKRLLELFFPEAGEKTYLLREFEPGSPDVPDPIGSGREMYERCRDVLKKALPSLLQLIENQPMTTESLFQDQSSTRSLAAVDPQIAQAIENERRRQFENIELIASENFTSRAVMEAQGSCLTNKYAEGYPGRRWYGGCEYVDIAESLAIERAKQLFSPITSTCNPTAEARQTWRFTFPSPAERPDPDHGSGPWRTSDPWP